MKHRYERDWPWALDHSALVLAGSLLLLLVAVVALFRTGRALLPEFNEGTLAISSVTRPGTSLEESDKLGKTVERILLSVPEVSATARRTGRAELDEHVQGVESAEIDVGLTMRDRPKAAMLADMRERLSLVPGMNFMIGQPICHRINHMFYGARGNIAVKIIGDDLQTLRDIAKQVQAAMSDVPGVVDLSTEQQTDIPAARVRFDRAALARYGMPVGDETEALQIAFVGQEVGQILKGQGAFPFVLHYPLDNHADHEAVRQTLIDTPSGARVPLGGIADIREDRGPNFISRKNVQRKIVMMCNVAGRDLRSVVNGARRHVQASVTLPRGYHIDCGGQFESEAEASRLLMWLGLAVIVGILSILTAALWSFTDAVIMFNLRLALIGGVVGVFLSGGGAQRRIHRRVYHAVRHRHAQPDHDDLAHKALAEGRRSRQLSASRDSWRNRAPLADPDDPLPAGLALIPLALRTGKPGSENEAPMAIVILFGLLSSPFLNMVVVPAVYFRFGRKRAQE